MIFWWEVVRRLMVGPLLNIIIFVKWFRILVFAVTFFAIIVVNQVGFVRHKNYYDISIGELSNLLKPVLQIYKRLVISDVINKESPNSETIVSSGYAQKLSCAGSVPDLRAHFLIAIWEVDSLEFKLNPVSCLGIWIVLVPSYPQQEVGLPNVLISDNNNFVKVIKLFTWIIKSIRNPREL